MTLDDLSPIPQLGVPSALFAATTGLWGMAARRWNLQGLDWEVAANLLTGSGALCWGLVQASKEVRAWLDRRAVTRQPNPDLLRFVPRALDPRGDQRA